MRAQQVNLTIGTASVLALPANPKRHRLLLSSDGTNTITISFVNPAVADQGIVLTPTNPVQRLDDGDVGELITSALYAVASASGAKLTIFEGFE